MRTSTAHSSETTAANLAQLSLFDPFIFELTDQVVLTFQPGVVGTAPAGTVGQPIDFKGWRLTLRGSPGEIDTFDAPQTPSTQVPLVKFAADLTVQMITSSEAADSRLASAQHQGINLDKQTEQFLQLQRSYQAAAQFLQIAQIKLDTLMQTMWINNEDKP